MSQLAERTSTRLARGYLPLYATVVLDVVWLAIGLIFLYFGAEWLVAGAAGLARSIGVSALVVGLTVVAYGTSAPEVVVGIQAAIANHPGIALGNVIGSNIANLGLILGMTALVSPPQVHGALPRREVPMLLASTIALPLLLIDGHIARWEAGILLVLSVAYTVWMVRSSRRDIAEAREAAEATEEAADEAGAPHERGRLKLGLLALTGLGTLVLGGKLFVDGASGIARALGMSETLVGLTIVAVGTSLPELATSLIAAFRGHADIAVGNVIGSNIFNVLLCLGAAALLGTVGAPLSSLAKDLVVLAAVTLLAAAMMRTARRITRLEGAVLLGGYLAYLTALAVVA